MRGIDIGKRVQYYMLFLAFSVCLASILFVVICTFRLNSSLYFLYIVSLYFSLFHYLCSFQHNSFILQRLFCVIFRKGFKSSFLPISNITQILFALEAQTYPTTPQASEVKVEKLLRVLFCISGSQEILKQPQKQHRHSRISSILNDNLEVHWIPYCSGSNCVFRTWETCG